MPYEDVNKHPGLYSRIRHLEDRLEALWPEFDRHRYREDMSGGKGLLFDIDKPTLERIALNLETKIDIFNGDL